MHSVMNNTPLEYSPATLTSSRRVVKRVLWDGDEAGCAAAAAERSIGDGRASVL